MAEISSTSSPTYDYSSIGSVGGEAAQSVNGEMINKIRAAEEVSVIDPITEKIENLTSEKEKIDEIKEKAQELQDIVSFFDLYNEENVFQQYLFDTTGSAAVYDAENMSLLKEGTTTVNITQVAQRDVYQTSTFNDKEATVASGTLSIKIGAGDTIDFDTSSGKTYEELAQEIDGTEGLSASVEKVGDSDYRIIIKSTESGLENSLSISQTGLDLGLSDANSNSISDWSAQLSEGSLTINGQEITANMEGKNYTEIMQLINDHGDFTAVEDNGTIKVTANDGSAVTVVESGTNNLGFSSSSQVQKAQNLNATIDGVEYDTSSNSITTQGSLKITALEVGTSSITVSQDTSAVTVAAEAMATKYNELMDMIDEELYSTDSVIENKDTLRTIQSTIKNMLFANYGAETPTFGTQTDEYGDIVKAHSNVTNNDKNIFTYGFELDKSGELTVDTDKFDEAVKENFDDLKAVFTGAYENKGIGVQMKEYLDSLDGYQGLLSTYEDEMVTREEELNEEKEDELERLDAKYGIMAEQFAAYSAIIAQIESSFSGLKMMIEQSTASN